MRCPRVDAWALAAGFTFLIASMLFPIAAPGSGLREVWSVSDDTLESPIGVIDDVAVAEDGTTFLLDAQLAVIHVIDPSGRGLPARGREGGGPEEYYQPSRIAATRQNFCLVFQRFDPRVVCLSGEDRPCVGPSLASARGDWHSVMIQRAQIDRAGWLVLGLTRGLARSGPGMDGTAYPAIVLLPPGGNEAEVLLSTIPGEGSAGQLPELGPSRFTSFGWDLNGEGTLLYADPDGADKVYLLSIHGGESGEVSLDFDSGMLGVVARFEAANGLESGSLPLVERVAWIDDNRFLVRPIGSALHQNSVNNIGTCELYAVDGTHLGSAELDQADTQNDMVFFRAGRLVVVEGGRRASKQRLRRWEEELGRTDREVEDEDVDSGDVIIVRQYDLSSLPGLND